MMDEKIRNIMKQESEIPDIVTKRMEDTFEHLAGMKKENKKNKMIYLFEHSYIKVAAITLVCILSLGTTAYAAVKYFGLMDFLGKAEITESESVEKLTGETMEDISRCSLDITLRDYSSQEEKTYMPVMENGWEDSGFDLDAVEVTETELGVYATYVYKAEQVKEDQYIGFILSDADGNKFDYMPYYINGGEEIKD